MAAAPRGRRRTGELAIVLHTHMPYVEGGGEWPHPDNPPNSANWQGFGTWPFGEEWLWEAIATSYLPLVDVLDGGAPITLSLTPVLCDQLEAPRAVERCIRFLREVRPESHERDIAGFTNAGHRELIPELRRSAGEYQAAADRLAELGGDLLGALAPHASWTSSATHAVLPMIATDSGLELQVQSGVASHRRRFGGWGGGFWLPECAHAPWLHAALEEAGVKSTCVELTDRFGLGDEAHLRPLQTNDGPVLWPIDRAIMSLVWSEDGYPASSAYRNYHGLTDHHHRVWDNRGGRYDHAVAAARAREHATEFVAAARARVQPTGGVSVCALDTELLGHWWYEGVIWLRAVLDEAARQGLALTTLDDALSRLEPVPAPADLGVSTWGQGRDLRTWSAPQVADLAWAARAAELKLLGALPQLSGARRDRALRELLALQSSDWAFLATRELAGDYPRQRAAAHRRALEQAIALEQEIGDPRVRNLAPDLVLSH